MKTNLENCLQFMRSTKPKKEYNNVRLGIKGEKELMFKLNLIPEESKRIIVARWGLDGTKPCSSFKMLNQMLGADDSRELYAEALKELAMTKYMVAIDEHGSMSCVFANYSPSEFDLAVRYAYLKWAVYNKIEPFGISVAEVKKQSYEDFYALSERDEKVINLRFGFTDGTFRSLEETAGAFHVTKERIRQIEAKALRRLAHRKWGIPLEKL